MKLKTSNSNSFLEMVLLALFIAISIVQIIAQIFPNEILSSISKPLIIPCLFSFAFLHCKNNGFKFEKSLFFALFFCWLGDCLLMGQKYNDNFFIFGLIAFLIGHIFYISINLSQIKQINKIDILVCLPMVFWAIFLLSKIKSSFFIPILIYSIALCGLYFSAFLARKKYDLINGKILFIGAILFIASDSMIAFNKFITPFENAGALIMLSYIVAQFMMVWVLVKPKRT